MNQQNAPVYQETEKVLKKPRQRNQQDNFSKVERESVEEFMRQMNVDDDDIIDSEHDPNVEVTEDYGDDD
jgi:ribosomal protein L18E